MRYIIFLIFIFPVYGSYSQTIENSQEWLAKYENIRQISEKEIDDLIQNIKPLDNSSFILSKKISGVISYRVIVNENGNFEDALLLHTSFKNDELIFLIDSLIVNSLKQSTFKSLGNQNIKYSFLIFYRFKKGKVFPPIVNGITLGIKKSKKEDTRIDKPPYILKRAELVIPDNLKRKYLNKYVVVSATIGRDGFVEYATIIKSVNPIIDLVAVDTTMKMEFRPALRNHKPVRIKMSIPYKIK